uniref:Uncharacterized protein n=1 Tax=Tetranychus urticae TaxID=32264 RepID=T1JQL2_TETUR
MKQVRSSLCIRLNEKERKEGEIKIKRNNKRKSKEALPSLLAMSLSSFNSL